MSNFDEENYYDPSIDDDLNTEGQDLLNINKCEEKLSSKVLKSKIVKNVFPEIENMENSNSKITNTLDELMNSALNENADLANANEESLQILSELLISHAVIDEHLDSIRDLTDKL